MIQKPYRIILLWICLLSSHYISAQTGGFRVDTVAGCAPLTINVIDTSTFDPSFTRAYFYEYNPDLPLGDQEGLVSNTYTYTEPGVYSILQFISTPGPVGDTTVLYDVVKVVAPTTPQFQFGICENRQVSLQVTDTVYEELYVNWGDGNTSTLSQAQTEIHTYASTGNFTIQISGGFPNGGGSCKDSTLNIQAFNQLPVANISSANVNELGDITLEYTISDFVTYELQEKLPSGSYQTIQEIEAGSSSLTLNGKNANDGLCYRIATTNVCTSTTLASNEICFLEMPTASASVAGIQLDWISYQGNDFDRYEIFRDGTLVGTLNIISQNSFSDADVTCLQEYCYSIKTTLNDGTEINQFVGCETSQSTGNPTTATNFIVSIVDNQALLSWELSSSATPKSFFLYKTIGSNTDSVAVSGNSYADEELNVNQQIACYQLKITDSCENVASSISVCNILLTGRKQGADNLIEWQLPSNLNNYDDLAIEKLDENLNVTESISITTTDDSYTDFFSNLSGQIARYRIRATDTGRGLTVYSNIASIIESLEVQVPDAFTPDDDGLNDNLEIFGNYISTIKIQVFNRWGILVFESEAADETWDGNYEGKKATQGIYTYLIQGKDTFGNDFTKKGTVLLIRR